MQNLFRILLMLSKPVDEDERKRLREIFKFFGFHPTEEEDRLVYYPKQQPRALEILRQTANRGFKCKEDKIKIQTEIFKFLAKRGIIWKEKLEEAITTVRNKRCQCPAYKLGESCERFQSSNQSCPYLHAPLMPKSFDLLTEYDMMAVELEVYVQHGAEEVMERNKELDRAVSCFIPKDFEEKYKACIWLVEDLIPENYHIAKISSKPEQVHDMLKKLRSDKPDPKADQKHDIKAIKKRMIRYLKSLNDEMQKEERKDNIKVFVMIRFVSHLLNLQQIKPEEIMFKFEQSMDKQCPKKEFKRKKEWAVKLGLMLDEVGGDIYIRSIARRFCDGYDKISAYNNDPSEALIQFTKFCVLMSNTGSTELLPHYNHLLLWMEYYTTVAFCLSARVQNAPNFFFVVPESYISVVHFIDATFVNENGVSTFEAVHRHRSWKSNDTNLFQDRLRRMIGILCGFHSRINLIRHIFQSSNPEKQVEDGRLGIAERLLVLVLVYVCNLGKCVFPDVETTLMGELCKIEVQENYPSRLSETLQLVQQSDSPSDVARALQTLLSRRENDTLRYYIWDNNMKRHGLRSTELKATELNKRFFLEEETLQVMDHPHDVVLNNVETLEHGDDMDTQITMEEKQKIDRVRKEQEKKEREDKASRVITESIRRSIFRSKVQNLTVLVQDQLKREKIEEKMKVFESAQITDTKCGICGVQFREIAADPAIPVSRQTSTESQTSHLLREIAADPALPVSRQTSTESQTSHLLRPPSPLLLPQPNFDPMQQNMLTPSPDKLKDNPFAKLFEHPSEPMPDTTLQKSNLETREDHEQSQKHKEMVKYQQLFRSKYKRDISEPLEEVRSFIQKYKLSTDTAEKYYKAEIYYINKCCREKENVESKIKAIIEKSDWQNEEIQQDVHEMVGSFNNIKKYIEEEARKRKEKSERQREEALRAKASVEDWEDEIEHIEQVVEEPQREKRPPRGRGKRKSQRH